MKTKQTSGNEIYFNVTGQAIDNTIKGFNIGKWISIGTFVFVLIILTLQITLAADNNYFTNQEFNISVLFINGTQRIIDGNCNISIYSPNGSISLNNSAMTHTGYGWY